MILFYLEANNFRIQYKISLKYSKGGCSCILKFWWILQWRSCLKLASLPTIVEVRHSLTDCSIWSVYCSGPDVLCTKRSYQLIDSARSGSPAEQTVSQVLSLDIPVSCSCVITIHLQQATCACWCWTVDEWTYKYTLSYVQTFSYDTSQYPSTFYTLGTPDARPASGSWCPLDQLFLCFIQLHDVTKERLSPLSSPKSILIRDISRFKSLSLWSNPTLLHSQAHVDLVFI